MKYVRFFLSNNDVTSEIFSLWFCFLFFFVKRLKDTDFYCPCYFNKSSFRTLIYMLGGVGGLMLETKIAVILNPVCP